MRIFTLEFHQLKYRTQRELRARAYNAGMPSLVALDLVSAVVERQLTSLGAIVHAWQAIFDELLSLPVSDAQRAGQRLRVYTTPPTLHDEAADGVWFYEIVGERDGTIFGSLSLGAPGGLDLPLEFIGLGLMLGMNSTASTDEERRAYETLAGSFRDAVHRLAS